MPDGSGDISKVSKHAKKSSRKIRICPFCRKATLRVADSISGWMTADMFNCDNCGYRGPVYIEVDPDELAKIQRDSSEEEQEE